MTSLLIQPHHLADDGTFPNNVLPLLVYQQSIQSIELGEGDSASAFERLFSGNGWDRSWRNGIYGFQHYHSTAHEVLGIACGSAKVEFGGPQGIELAVTAGDAVLIPAGVSHYNLGASADLLVVGAYPPGPDWDLCRDTGAEYEKAITEVARVPLPATDPVGGTEGGLHTHWKG